MFPEIFKSINLRNHHRVSDRTGLAGVNMEFFTFRCVKLESAACVLNPQPPVLDKGHKKPALRKVQQICSIPFRSTMFPSYFHSFGMTENYIVFVEQPFKLDIIKLATAYFRGVTWGSCLKFDKDDAVSPSLSRLLLRGQRQFQGTFTDQCLRRLICLNATMEEFPEMTNTLHFMTQQQVCKYFGLLSSSTYKSCAHFWVSHQIIVWLVRLYVTMPTICEVPSQLVVNTRQQSFKTCRVAID